MARRKKDREPSPSAPSRPSNPSPSRPVSSTPSRPVTSPVTPAGPSHTDRLRSEHAQRDIYAARIAASHTAERMHGVLSGVPARLANTAAQTAANIDAQKTKERRAKLRRSLINKSRLVQKGALTEKKPERSPLRSPEKVRAQILKCKSRPTKKSPRRGKGGGGKRFIPWC